MRLLPRVQPSVDELPVQRHGLSAGLQLGIAPSTFDSVERAEELVGARGSMPSATSDREHEGARWDSRCDDAGETVVWYAPGANGGLQGHHRVVSATSVSNSDDGADS